MERRGSVSQVRKEIGDKRKTQEQFYFPIFSSRDYVAEVAREEKFSKSWSLSYTEG